MRGKVQEIISKNMYIAIIRTNLEEIAEMEPKTICVYLLVQVKKIRIFKIVNLRMSRLSISPKKLNYDIIVSIKTRMLI